MRPLTILLPMIPVRTVIPSRTVPAAALTLIGVSAAAFLWVRWSDGAIPSEDPFAARAAAPAALLVALYTHGDWPRLALDLLCLWLFGENVEDRTGHARFAALYLLCGFAAALAPMAIPAESLVRGLAVSGAVGGIIGAHLSLFPQSRIFLLVPAPPWWSAEVPALAVAAFWTTVHLALGVLPAMAVPGASPWNSGVPGVVAAMALGALAVRACTRRERMRPEWWHDGRYGNGTEETGYGMRDAG